jgi:hypothetical protein
MDESLPSTSLLQKSARRLRAALTAAFWIVAALLLLERLGYAGVYRGGGIDLGRVGLQLLLSLPAILYLAALWKLRSAVAEAARGAHFGRVAIAASKAAGALLIAGSLASLFVVPMLARLAGEPVERLINADVATLILAAIGMGQMFVAALMERAADAERELESFF